MVEIIWWQLPNLQTYPPTYLPNYLPTYMPIYLPPLEPPDNHQEPPDNRQEPEDFYFWYTTSAPETCSQLFLNLLNFSPTFSTFFQPISFFSQLFFFKFCSTCDIWDTDYNTDNWEPGIMTIFVTWQLIVTLDSIRNSCDVF